MIHVDNCIRNEDVENRALDRYSSRGLSSTEEALHVHLSRFSEWVIESGCWSCDTDFETLEFSVCVDHFFDDIPPRVPGNFMWPTFTVIGLARYHPIDSDDEPDHLDDLFIHDECLLSREACPWYSDDRDVFAERLLPILAKEWHAIWHFWKRIQPSKNLMPWPLTNFWVYGHPGRVWRLEEDGTLALLNGAEPMDESLIIPTRTKTDL